MSVGESKPLVSLAEGFAGELAGLGCVPGTIAKHLRVLRRLDEWLVGEGLSPGGLTGTEIDRFVQVTRSAGGRRWPSQRGVGPLVGYLREAGVIPPAARRGPVDEPLGRVVAAYRRYLTEERGLAASSVENYERYVWVFVSALRGSASGDLSLLSVPDVTGAVRAVCRSRSVGWARNFNTMLRSLLRFLFLEGHVAVDLSPSVLSVAAWRHSGLPKAIEDRDVASLVQSCARARRSGRRDLAILLLMIRLGLRAGEVAALRLEDIDWRAGEVVVRGKTARHDRLPLPVDVGEAMVDYLRHERPATTCRSVFILSVAPRTAISACTVGGVAGRACERAGLAPIGPHRFRHTAATAMLRGGASLAEVGQVLRHQHQETTSIYAKVDVGSLSMLAMPWPQVLS